MNVAHFIRWCRRLCIAVLILLSLYDREWGFACVLLISELLLVFEVQQRIVDAEDATVRRVRKVGL